MGIALILLMILDSAFEDSGAAEAVPRLGARRVASSVPARRAPGPQCPATGRWWRCLASANLRASFTSAAVAMFFLSGPLVRAAVTS
ncbi:hypothetical protein XFF6166_430002 [Xanthomonas citri pv. fuscans]|nr:hypothetical protein XFF6166_430002 [Xanthomonas citri pv. fuscans]SOO04048.1 hypothetical protein XFF6960_920007 [Xanthomonas citri pv. fuscans]SOO06024.1 hypothetical protein XFF7767_590002 [Xanthomonas citri pv. fuscans]SOO10709.1 hypothetical protein XFF6970_620007 [Xanthomonas citri pv. fuscans]SOO16575.1 hypothetical protein XFF7766_840002 [Xanthomonas citri pv. fuscans]